MQATISETRSPTSAMFVALPTIQRSLALTDSTRQWVVTSYTLALAGLLLLGGRLADRFGARRTLMIGVAGFAVASVAGGLSPDGAMLIAARAVQGAFGAVLVSSTKSLLITVYSDEKVRMRAMGYFTATLTAGMALGFVLGGVITSGLGWRWCLYLNVVFSAVALVGARRILPFMKPHENVRVDVTSAVLATAGMSGLVYGLGEAAASGWRSVQVVASLVAAVAFLAAFVSRQRVAASPLLPLRVVFDRIRGWGTVALMVNGLSTFGMMLILTFQLQSVSGYTALETGLALVPFALFAAVGSAFVAPRLMRALALRSLVALSVLVEAAGLVPLIWLTPHSHYAGLILVAVIIEGFGTGVAGPASLNLALSAVNPSERGAAGAWTSTAGQLGSSVGAALLNTIAAAATAGYLVTRPLAGSNAATVHGFAVAMVWGTAILVVAAIPMALIVCKNLVRR